MIHQLWVILNRSSNFFSPNNLSSPTATPSQPNHHAYQNKPTPNLVPQNYFNFNNIDQNNNNNISYRVTKILLGYSVAATPEPRYWSVRVSWPGGQTLEHRKDTIHVFVSIICYYIIVCIIFRVSECSFCDSI